MIMTESRLPVPYRYKFRAYSATSTVFESEE